ncbi:response regulator [Chryseobacterium luteum]|uniref:Inactive Receiver domain-containing protein n=1 Tax=Chryseobacterium luteum TaxID=421531 RepID=A0A085ZTA9_9FLAO|nr:response regulator [Chryseobacterium luteum]KFF07673.1 hypothetical protein IX38_09685 [Chryseobacterium luteum]
MNKLIVHSQNTVLNSEEYFKIDEQFVFNVDSDILDVDFYIHDQIINKELGRKINQCDIIFIKVGLTQNFMEYYGIRLACHIRMTQSLGEKNYIPIVLISQESCQFLGLTGDLSEILFTEGVYLMEDNPKDLNKYIKLFNENKLKSSTKIDDFLSKIRIKPCIEYDSHHSIANEWSLLGWAQILQIDQFDQTFISIKQNTEGLLYYKYLALKHPILFKTSSANINFKGGGKILYIDDEWNKGWNIIFKHIFKDKSSYQFKTFEYNFTDKEFSAGEPFIKSEIETFDPDIVILDLRLFKKDFEKDRTPENLSGFKILEYIKKINLGIQIIIFTASNKVWNFQKLQSAGADYFIIKNSPENIISAETTLDSIEKFTENIKKASEKSFIKNIVVICKKISQFLYKTDTSDNLEYELLVKNLVGQLKVCLSALTLINIERNVTIDIAFLSFYNFFELFKEYYLKYEDYKYKIGFEEIIMLEYKLKGNKLSKGGTYIKEHSSFDAQLSFFLTALFFDYFKIDELKTISAITLCNARNAYFHGSKKNFSIEELELITQIICEASSKLRE